jgi:dTDP-4-dehydrorhamnose reductase
MDKVLILGDTGKLGQALREAFAPDFEVCGSGPSSGFDAGDPGQVRRLLESTRPRIVLNAVALNGLDACERNPDQALRLNALLPKELAADSRALGFKLIHFSSDTVFDGRKRAGGYVESDSPCPINVYGLTKFGGDCFIQAEATDFLLFRLSVLAGTPGRNPQLIEGMIARAQAGEALRVAQDIVCSPSSARDVASAVRQAVLEGRPSGLYHLANAGCASLHELIREVLLALGLDVPVQPVSHQEFPSLARKNPYTVLETEKGPALRPWQEAIRDYCRHLQAASSVPNPHQGQPHD